VYIKQPTSGTPTSGVVLNVYDNVHALAHSVTFTFGSGVATVTSTAGGATGLIEDLPDGWMRLSCVLVLGAVNTGATAVGNALRFKLSGLSFGGGVSKTFYAWGARYDAAATPGDYVLPANKYLRALTVADYTFLLNTQAVPAMTGSTTSADWSSLNAYLYVRAGNYKGTYTVKLKKTGGSVQTIKVRTWNGTTRFLGTDVWDAIDPYDIAGNGGVFKGTIRTDDIAKWLTDQINSADDNAATVAGVSSLLWANNESDFTGNGVAADGWSATRTGSLIKISRTNATTIESIEVTDSNGGNDAVLIWKGIDNFDSLPLVFEDGVTVKILGDPTAGADDFYVKFAADKSGTTGNGQWIESTGFAVHTALDPNKMPWQLVRKQDDGAGTVTGTPYAKYFEWGPATWTARTVGDETLAPNPSFVGKAMGDIFFYRNRMGLLAGQNVLFTEAGRYFNFFRTTMRQILDSDPIDVAATHTEAITLRAAAPSNNRLILFSDQVEFELASDPILSPRTVQTKPILEYVAQRFSRPRTTAKEVLFAAPRGGYTAIWSVVPSPTTDNVDANELSAQVPRYIPGDALEIIGSTPESLALVLPTGERGALYSYKYFFNGDQRIQSAWSKYTLAGARILGGAFIDNALYLAVQRENACHLEKSVIASGRVDDGATYVTHLDQRLQAGPDTTIQGVYNGGSNTTTWTLPLAWDSGVQLTVVTRASAAYGITYGTEVQTAAPINLTTSSSTVAVTGDYSGTPVWIGRKYTTRYVFTTPILRSITQTRGAIPVSTGRYQIGWMTLVYADTFAVTALVTAEGRAQASSSVALAAPANGKLRFGVLALADTVALEAQSSSPFPFKLEGAEFEASFSTTSQRYNG
jgi:hypothetical protein